MKKIKALNSKPNIPRILNKKELSLSRRLEKIKPLAAVNTSIPLNFILSI